MQIIRRGYILPEEHTTYQHLERLPGSWWCIGGNANRFTFQQNQGTQIDFLVICPKGVFLLESKNVHTIELKAGNTVEFLTADGQTIRRSDKHANPVEEVIDLRYQVKDWLYRRHIESFLTSTKKLNVFVHGIVLLANEQHIHYRNCSLQELNYSKHKLPTLLSLSSFDESFIESIQLPKHCVMLSPEKMYFLFKLFHNPDMDIGQIFTGLNQERTQVLEEKQIYLEKIKLLEQDNITLNTKSNELESTRNNLLSMNQEHQNTLKHAQSLNEQLQTHIQTLQKENAEHIKKTHALESKLKASLKAKHPVSTRYKHTTWLLTGLLGLVLCFWGFSLTKDSEDLIHASLVGRISTHLTRIEQTFQRGAYNALLQLWENTVLRNQDISIDEYHRYEHVCYYIARAYQETHSHQKALQYFDIFLALTKEPESLLKTYFFKSHSAIASLSHFKQSILELKNALTLNSTHFSDTYTWKGPLLWNLAQMYQTIHFKVPDAQKKQLQIDLAIPDFLQESIRYYQQGKDLAQKHNNKLSQANINYELGHIFMNTNNFSKALEHYTQASQVLELLTPNTQIIEKLLLINHEIGLIFSEQGNYAQAEEYFNMILELCKDEKSLLPEANRMNLGAQFYLSLGTMFESKKEYNKALQAYTTGQEMARKYSAQELVQEYHKKVHALTSK